ncbi:hypothetical protein [Paraclostridium dentum]|uniref:hypothetical protein n=1 Tax=Paraclostridium dentum TaxID=2662455 RepID=UPI003464D6D3
MINEILKIGNSILKFLRWVGLDNWITLFSALIGLGGVYLTIQFTRSQFNEDKRVGIKPHLNLICKDVSCWGDYIVESDIDDKFYTDNPYHLFRKMSFGNDESFSIFYIALAIENIGLGHALNFRIINIYGENTQISIMENLSIIKKENELKILLEVEKYVQTKFISLLDQANNNDLEKDKLLMDTFSSGVLFQEHPKDSEDLTVTDKLINQSNEKIYIDVEYDDLLKNKYRKTFCIELYFDLAFKNGTTKPLIDDKFPDYLLSGEVKVLDIESKEFLIS